ncbi:MULTISPECIES: C10 family peptidase [unclassified Alistipes]|uniref:C10 family peptidase n=1 Tax=unclassified Alistipes TaxID=2608932 RepID=UPI000B885677|nr:MULTISPECIES: C10 family peptidase [unclassified Alistipes]
MRKFHFGIYVHSNFSLIGWFSQPERIDKIGMDPIYQSIDDNKPVYMFGQSAQNTGHAWVADGYSEGSRKVYTKLRWEPGGYTSTQITTEKVKLLHFNWGYQGESDGYFFEGIFDMMDREYRDPIDTDYHAYENLGNYNIRTGVIIY